jgi:type VI secretion system protein
MTEPEPSLYETLLQNFNGDLDLFRVEEDDRYILSVLDNLQRILNSRAGALSHLADYGLPDMGQVLEGLPSTAHALMGTMANTLLKYEPRLSAVTIDLLPQTQPGHLRYTLDVLLQGSRRVMFGTTLSPEGRVLVSHLKQQGVLSTTSVQGS